jgi:hypothetical protein
MMKRHHWIDLLGAAAIFFGLAGGSAFADETVNIGRSHCRAGRRLPLILEVIFRLRSFKSIILT